MIVFVASHLYYCLWQFDNVRLWDSLAMEPIKHDPNIIHITVSKHDHLHAVLYKKDRDSHLILPQNEMSMIMIWYSDMNYILDHILSSNIILANLVNWRCIFYVAKRKYVDAAMIYQLLILIWWMVWSQISSNMYM